MKILYVTTIGITMGFFPALIQRLIDNGHRVDLACNDRESPVSPNFREMGCKIHTLSCTRSPFSAGNIAAVKELRELVIKERYDIVHCHTPIAAACTRLACRGLGCKVIYTAHGFHFYKGAPLKNWLIFYPVEKFCAPMTDLLITINREDYALAQKRLKAKQVLYVPGVGVDLEAFTPGDGSALRQQLDIPFENKVLLSVGELSHRKNHEILIRAAAEIPNTTVVIAGAGPLEDQLKVLAAELSCDVRFLGYRRDIAELCRMCDVFVLPSIHEGLPVSLMEAMACGKPVCCSHIRGSVDLVDTQGGVTFDPHSVADCRRALQETLAGDSAAMGQRDRKTVQAFSTPAVIDQMLPLYETKKEC